MCAVFRRERPALIEEPRPTGTAVRWLPEEGDWAVHAECEHCGGYRMLLHVGDEDASHLAETRAGAFLTRVHSRGGCLGCEAHAWRSNKTPSTGQSHVWWDTETDQWMAYRELPGFGPGASFPLGITTFWAPQEVRAAARALWSSDRLPLRVASDPAAVDPDTASIYYDVESGRWQLSVPCFDCEGFRTRLTSFGRGAVEAACDEAMGMLDLIAREGCPTCRTERERATHRTDEDEPRIWFDTDTRDWLVWQPVEGCSGGVTMPLGIGRFDARRAVVYRAAAGLLFDSELFLDEGL
jgi:hypothetical protein